MPAIGKFARGRWSVIANDVPRFADKVLRAVKGEQGLVEPSYVYLPGIPGGEAIAKEVGSDFFSVPIELGVS